MFTEAEHSYLEEGTSKPFLLQRAEAETPENSGGVMMNPLTGEVTRVEYGRISPSETKERD